MTLFKATVCSCCGLPLEGVPTDVGQRLPRAAFEARPQSRVKDYNGDIVVIDGKTPQERVFLRGVLRIPVQGTQAPIALGLWVEMPMSDVDLIMEKWWKTPKGAPLFAGVLSATHIPGIPDVDGCETVVELSPDPTQRPALKVKTGGIVEMQEKGVTIPEWHAIAAAWSGDAAKC